MLTEGFVSKKRYEEYLSVQGIQQLANDSKALAFLNDEEDLCLADDIKESMQWLKPALTHYFSIYRPKHNV